MKRTNFVAEMIDDTTRPGVQEIIERVKQAEDTPESVVDTCLDVMGPLVVDSDLRQELIDHAESLRQNSGNGNGSGSFGEGELAEILQLVVSTRDYQFA
jgi:hypothetical protein